MPLQCSTLFIGADHAAYEHKSSLVAFLQQHFPNLQIQDLGTHSSDSVDYPDIAHALAQRQLETPQSMGILLCGTGLGMSYSANRHSGIRAALVHDVTTARLSRQHNDANILCMGSRILGLSVMEDCTMTFLTTDFDGGRHARRVQKVDLSPSP